MRLRTQQFSSSVRVQILHWKTLGHFKVVLSQKKISSDFYSRELTGKIEYEEQLASSNEESVEVTQTTMGNWIKAMIDEDLSKNRYDQ